MTPTDMTALRESASKAIANARLRAHACYDFAFEAMIAESSDPEFALNRVRAGKAKAIRLLAAFQRAEDDLVAWVREWVAAGRPD